MRLTLRNLLRFLDQTDMRAVERNQLESLVAGSSKATKWIDKIQEVKGQPDLQSLAINDPDYTINHIAAYLDSMLGEETTVDLERSLLSRDELLAEIASCHAIRESNSISPNIAIPLELRQAIYDLRLQPITVAGRGSASKSGVSSSADRRMEDLPFVDAENDAKTPEISVSDTCDIETESTVSIDVMYKKAKRRSQLVAALIGAVLIIFLAFAFELGRRSGKDQQAATTPADAKESPNADKKPDEPTATEPRNTKENNADAAENPDGDNQLAPEHEDTPGSLPTPPATGSLAEGEPENTVLDETKLAQRPVIEFTLKSGALPTREKQPVAKVETENSIILKRVKDAQQWVRVNKDSPILEDTEMMVLAGTEAKLNLRDNLTVTITGPARFTVGMNDIASDSEVLMVSHGIFTVEANLADVDLIWERSERRYRMTLPITPAIATAEFMQYQLPGNDPRSVKPTQLDLFYTQAGRSIITEGESTWRLSESMAMARVVPPNPNLSRPPTIGSLPLPLSEERDYTVRLTDTVEKQFPQVRAELTSNQKLYDFLVKLKNDSKQERRFAAISWLAASGEFAFLLDFLNDEKNRNNWRSAIEAVQAAIINHPEYADKLETELSEISPEEGNKIYNMIIGYSEQQLIDGADSELVELLDSVSLATRVVAIDSLRQITGVTYNYNANANREARRRSIKQKWEKTLERKELRYPVHPQLPLPELLPLKAPPDENAKPLEDAVDNGG